MEPESLQKNTVKRGDVFGRLTVQESGVGSRNIILCLCLCGTLKKIQIFRLIKGMIVSCGCRHAEFLKSSNSRTHGLSKTVEYRCWREMKRRCLDHKRQNYERYGGRGISVCAEWVSSFEAFFEHVGNKPTRRHSIDRYPNPDGNYEPGNVRWAIPKEQRRNTNKRIHPLTALGKTMLLSDWSDETGLTRSCIHKRIQNGMTPDEAVTMPAMSNVDAARNATRKRWGSEWK